MFLIGVRKFKNISNVFTHTISKLYKKIILQISTNTSFFSKKNYKICKKYIHFIFYNMDSSIYFYEISKLFLKNPFERITQFNLSSR